MKPLIAATSAAAVSRFKQRILDSWSQRHEGAPAPAEKPDSRLPAVVPKRPVGFPASIAEFLLVFRLKARRRTPVASHDILERALRVVLVTCKNWFAGTDTHTVRPRKHD